MKTSLLTLIFFSVALTSCTNSEEPVAENIEAGVELSEIRSWEINRPDVIPNPYFMGALHDESLLVTDRSLNTINQFDSAGNLIKTFGGRGQGPGEIVSVTRASIHPDGRVAVLDNSNSRFQIYNTHNDSIVTGLIKTGWNPLIFLTNHEMIYTNAPASADAGTVMQFYNSESKQLEPFNQMDLVLEDPPPEQVSCMFCDFRFLDDRTFITTQNTPDYLMYRIDPVTNETLTLFTRPGVPPVEYTEAEQQEWIELRQPAMQLPFDAPDIELEAPVLKNRFEDYFVDHQERLWALMTVAEGELPYFDIFTSDGEYIGSKDLPEGAVSVEHFYEDRILFRYPSDNPDILKVRLFEIGN